MLGKCVDTDDMDNEDNLFTDVEQTIYLGGGWGWGD